MKYIDKFYFVSFEAFEDFIKKYWSYDQLFCRTDIAKICRACNLNDATKIEFHITKLFFMDKLKNGKYIREKEIMLLVYLANKMKSLGECIDTENTSASQLKNDTLKHCKLDENDEDDKKQKQKEDIENLVELLFGLKKRYEKHVKGFLISLLIAVIFLILICDSFNPYLLIMFLIALAASCCFGRSLYEKRKFNQEQRCLQDLGNQLDDKDLYTMDMNLPDQYQVEGYSQNNNNDPINNQPNVIPAQQLDEK